MQPSLATGYAAAATSPASLVARPGIAVVTRLPYRTRPGLSQPMDSLTQIALGAAVGTAVLGRKVGPKAALWGAVCGTLPDLDVLVNYGDPVRDFTFHRAESHSLFWLTLVSPVLAWLIHRLHRRAGATYREWLLLVWLALVTHALLDAMTVYGTQLLLPFSDYPVGLGSVFIIDPLYTVPLLAGVAAWLALRRRDPARALRWNTAGLALGTLYLGWTVAAQAHVAGVAHRSLAATPLADGRLLVTPTPFNSLLWRIVVMDDGGYYEGFRSLLDRRAEVRLERHASDARLLDGLQDDWTVRRLAWFSKGFYAVHARPGSTPVAAGSASTVGQLLGLVETAAAHDALPGGDGVPVVMTDLRMGQTPWFVFAFVVAEHDGTGVVAVPSRQVPTARPPLDALPRLWRRIWDEDLIL
jgi:inner membrane protein